MPKFHVITIAKAPRMFLERDWRSGGPARFLHDVREASWFASRQEAVTYLERHAATLRWLANRQGWGDFKIEVFAIHCPPSCTRRAGRTFTGILEVQNMDYPVALAVTVAASSPGEAVLKLSTLQKDRARVAALFPALDWTNPDTEIVSSHILPNTLPAI